MTQSRWLSIMSLNWVKNEHTDFYMVLHGAQLITFCLFINFGMEI